MFGNNARETAMLAWSGVQEGKGWQNCQGSLVEFWSNGIDPDTGILAGILVTDRGERVPFHSDPFPD